MTTVVVAAALANKPGNAGSAWAHLSWALAFRRLGAQVHFVEEIDHATAEEVAWFRSVTDWFGLPATLVAGNEIPCGLTREELMDLASEADLLLNVTGHLTSEELFRRFGARAYLDLDPGFTQIWEAQGHSGARLEGHHVFATVGGNIGDATCSIPTVGRAWVGVRQPVVGEDWPVTPVPPDALFTTVGTWRGPYGPVEHEGATLGLKVHEFRRFVELPTFCDASFELALHIHDQDSQDRLLLLENGWNLVDPAVVAGTPEGFRSYVQGSRAEFSVAQGVYVGTRSGWFSDRSVRYLASGRPVVVQDTGWPDHVPAGEGALAFSTLAEAVAGVEEVIADPERHGKAARALAEEYFSPRAALEGICEEVGLAL